MSDLEPKPVVVKKKQMIITVGMSSSGKSLWAKKHVMNEYARSEGKDIWVSLDRNDTRFRTLLLADGWKDYKTTVANEKLVSNRILRDFFSASKRGDNVIICDNNLCKKIRGRWYSLGIAQGYEVTFQHFNISLEEAYRRDQYRGDLSVGRERLNRQWREFLTVSGEPLYIPDTKLRNKVILVDLETVILNEDGSPNAMMCNMLSLYASRFEVSLIYLSKDHDKLREEKLKLLKAHLGFNSKIDILIMRYNETINQEYIGWKRKKLWGLAGNNHVIGVFDGCLESARMWRDLGIKDVVFTGDPLLKY